MRISDWSSDLCSSDLVLLFTAVPVQAQLDGNADEAKVAPYRLPDPLTMADGKRVTSAAEWTARRRPELLALFQRHIYGVTPPAPADMRSEEHTSELQSLMRISYAVFCLTNKIANPNT